MRPVSTTLMSGDGERVDGLAAAFSGGAAGGVDTGAGQENVNLKSSTRLSNVLCVPGVAFSDERRSAY